MDVIGDSCQAIHAYLERLDDSPDDVAFDYLMAYGVLQALYLQQDAAFYWCKFLGLLEFATFERPADWTKTVPSLALARAARNESTGHPVRPNSRNGQPLAAFFISQHSLDRTGFQLMETQANGPSKFRYVELLKLIEGQLIAISTTLEQATLALDVEDRTHYRSFMDQPLTAIWDRLHYPLGKLSTEDSASDWLMMPIVVPELHSRLAEIEAAVRKRGEPFDDSWDYLNRKLHYALSVLGKYVTDTTTCDKRLAGVLCDYVRYGFNELKSLCEEVDAEYLQGSKNADEPPRV